MKVAASEPFQEVETRCSFRRYANSREFRKRDGGEEIKEVTTRDEYHLIPTAASKTHSCDSETECQSLCQVKPCSSYARNKLVISSPGTIRRLLTSIAYTSSPLGKASRTNRILTHSARESLTVRGMILNRHSYTGLGGVCRRGMDWGLEAWHSGLHLIATCKSKLVPHRSAGRILEKGRSEGCVF
jgi:hypothetical protein